MKAVIHIFESFRKVSNPPADTASKRKPYNSVKYSIAEISETDLTR